MATNDSKETGQGQPAGSKAAGSRSPGTSDPEPPVVFQALSGVLGYVAIGFIAGLVLCTASHRATAKDEDGGGAATERHSVPPTKEHVTTTFVDPGPPVEPECPPEEGAAEPVRAFTEAPPICIDPSRTYVATVHTTRGDFEITLDSENAPITVNNFVFLARWRFWDNVGFHRAMADFVIDTGDPIGPIGGYGDPGYTIEEELPTGDPPYPELSVVMARDLYEPHSTGCLWFVVTGWAGETAPAYYSRFGRITDGEDTIRAIEATGDRYTGEIPNDQLTVIKQVTITEQPQAPSTTADSR